MLKVKKIVASLFIVLVLIFSVSCSSNQNTSLNQDDQTPVEQTSQQTQQETQQGQDQLQVQNEQPAQQQQAHKDIYSDEAKKLIDTRKDIQIIDVREDYEFAEGHLPGAKLIPVGQLQQRMNEISKDKPVLLYCASGARSYEAAQILTQSGYKEVYNLALGISGWNYDIEK